MNTQIDLFIKTDITLMKKKIHHLWAYKLSISPEQKATPDFLVTLDIYKLSPADNNWMNIY